MEKKLIYQDQSYRDLELFITKQQLNAQTLDPLKSGKISMQDVTAEIHIIGASDAIIAHFPACAITEVLACKKIKVDDYLYQTSFSKLKFPFFHNFTACEMNYSFSAQVHEWDIGLKTCKTLEDIIKTRHRGTLGRIKSFPKGVYGIKPKTLVFIDLRNPLGIGWKTIHSYPNEQKIVETTTTIKRG